MSSVSVNCPKQRFAVMGNLLFLKMLRAPKWGEWGISRAGRARPRFWRHSSLLIILCCCASEPEITSEPKKTQRHLSKRLKENPKMAATRVGCVSKYLSGGSSRLKAFWERAEETRQRLCLEDKAQAWAEYEAGFTGLL